jgi:hypothetical protein
VESSVVLEQKLRTRTLTIVTLLVFALFSVIVGVLIGTSKSHSFTPGIIVVLILWPVVSLSCAYLFSSIVVRVTDGSPGRSLEVLYGPHGIVRQRFGPDRLIAAYARTFSFAQMGGWGYRGSLKLFRRAALATRRGEALEIQLIGKRRFIVTVDNPEDYVAALNIQTG